MANDEACDQTYFYSHSSLGERQTEYDRAGEEEERWS